MDTGDIGYASYTHNQKGSTTFSTESDMVNLIFRGIIVMDSFVREESSNDDKILFRQKPVNSSQFWPLLSLPLECTFNLLGDEKIYSTISFITTCSIREYEFSPLGAEGPGSGHLTSDIPRWSNLLLLNDLQRWANLDNRKVYERSIILFVIHLSC